MFQAYDRVTQLPVIATATASEGDIFALLEGIYENRLKGTGRGQAFLNSGGEITRKMLTEVYEVKYAVGVWIMMENCFFFPERDVQCVFHLVKEARYEKSGRCGFYDSTKDTFCTDDYVEEFESHEVCAFLILPEYNP